MFRFAIRTGWFLTGLGTCSVGILAESTSVLTQVVVFLCGILSVLFSLTFGALLKHLSSHEEYRKSMDSLLKDYRTHAQCEEQHKKDDQYLHLRLKSVEDMVGLIAKHMGVEVPVGLPVGVLQGPQEPKSAHDAARKANPA